MDAKFPTISKNSNSDKELANNANAFKELEMQT